MNFMERDKNYEQITLQMIRIFLLCAETENFTETAAWFGLDQSTVSKSIKKLEERMGHALFVRQKKHVHLTPAGYSLFKKWKGCFGELWSGFSFFEQERKEYDSLIIGDACEYSVRDYALPFLEQWEAVYPDIELKYYRSDYYHLSNQLLVGYYDIAIAPFEMAQDFQDSGLNWKLFRKNRMTIVVNRENPLSRLEHLTIRDLKRENIICIHKEVHPSCYVFLKQLCKQGGLDLADDQICWVNGSHSIVTALIANRGVAICNDNFYPSCGTILKRYMLDNDGGGMVAAWNGQNPNPYVSEMVRFLMNDA